jgi:hypothetical protein
LNTDFDLYEVLEQAIEIIDTPIKKSVRFAEYDEVKEIWHRNDMTPQDFDALYMSTEEHTLIRQNALQDLCTFIDAEVVDGDENDASIEQNIQIPVCVRGLENQLFENEQRFQEAVNMLYDIVYDCQTYEDTHGVKVSDEYLAHHLLQVSDQFSEEARQRAARDAEEARQCR